MPPQKLNPTESPQFNNNQHNQLNKSISLNFMNHLLQIPQDCPIQFSIGRIKELVAFKKQHDCCHSSKKELKNLKTQIFLLRNQLNQNVNSFFMKQMQNDLNEISETKPLQSKNFEKETIQSNKVQLNSKQGPYVFYRKQKFQQIQNQNPNISFKELNEMLLSKWLNLRSEDKQQYTRKHEELLKNRLNSQV